MNAFLVLTLAGLTALTNWFIVAQQWTIGDWITKPGVILGLIASLLLLPCRDHLVIWMVLGLSLSMAGDIFLLLPQRFFLPGLGAFLGAHIAYIIAFNRVPPPLNTAVILFVIATITVTSLFYLRLYQALKKGEQNKYLLPTLLYAISIAGMLVSSLSNLARPEWSLPSSLLVSCGGLSFFLSDAVLAWHRFINPIAHRNLKVRLTYHLGQICLVGGVMLQSLP
ncbi:MAG: lysoplasmalogenase [Anaerolineales bacterium]